MGAATLTRVGVRTGGLRSLLARALRALARQRAERRALVQLHAMSDRQLADLGLHRDQIDAAVRGVRGC
jgi:uncharacterized protein YjiS (DUF1127 family)